MKLPTEAELPESWQPAPPPAVPELVTIPEPDHTDAAHLYAWYGPFGMAQDYRKVVLSSCEEVIRAQADGKITDGKANAKAHVHDAYLAYLERTLIGRIAYEREVLKRGFGA